MKSNKNEECLEQIMKKDNEDLTDKEIEIIENRIEELEKLLDYFNERDKVCLALDGYEERCEVEEELERLQEKI